MTHTSRPAGWPNLDQWTNRFLRTRTGPTPATATVPRTDLAAYLAEYCAARTLDAILNDLRQLAREAATPGGIDREHLLIRLEELGNISHRLHADLSPEWKRATSDPAPVLGVGFCGDGVTTPSSCDASTTGGLCDTCGQPQDQSGVEL